MLLRFGVSNHLSIRDPQELSFTASSLTDRREGLIDCPASPNGSIVPAAVIYGANASGKTNVLSAFMTMRAMVLQSHSQGEPDGGVPCHPFALDADNSNMPSRFDIDFVIEGVRHHYGFEATDTAVVAEWLYSFPKAYRRMLFEREGEEFEFGRGLSGPNKTIAGLTRPNSLYVSAAAQNHHEQLLKIFSYFRSVRRVEEVDISSTLPSTQQLRQEPDRRVIEFLARADTGIVDYRRKEIEVPEELRAFHQAITAVAKRVLDASLRIEPGVDEKQVVIELAHRARDGSKVFLDLSLESAGTRRLLVVLGSAFRALDEGVPIFIDELNASLHTRAGEAVLELFCSAETNPKGAQLVATTHDTNLMNSSALRRDQLWFAIKDTSGATQLYPLTDIRTRRGDNFEKAYLQGRFGAVPFDSSGSALG